MYPDHSSSQPPDPLRRALLAAANRTQDPLVRRWLTRLAERGQSAEAGAHKVKQHQNGVAK